MRYITVLGAGLLVGTALAVIIPEGVNALYMNKLDVEINHHQIHSDHKIIRRDINQIKTEKLEIIPPAAVGEPKKTNLENEHKHSDTTHSAIGILKILIINSKLFCLI